ncbi:C-type lectin domain family 7 member A-like [Polypterus senegalus]|uniref:C-type lectin domain family 7 member A-like n=1 Tax=Polypterus senegalus TaxID=55291 RepID=UPI001965D0D8|nr:C-type lectin domain family 7 member A-like [Polypterus senegalus]
MDDIYMNNEELFSSATSPSPMKHEMLKPRQSPLKAEAEVQNIYLNRGGIRVSTFSGSHPRTAKVCNSSLEEREERTHHGREADFCGLSARSCCWVVSSLTLLLIVLLIAFGMFFIHAEKKLHDLKKTYASLSENYTLANEELNQTRSNFSRLSTKYLTLQFNYSTRFEKKCSVCPDGWLTHHTSCYLISTDYMDWTASQDDCLAKGAHLVIIENESEQRFLNKHVASSDAWIGLTDSKQEEKWLWTKTSEFHQDAKDIFAAIVSRKKIFVWLEGRKTRGLVREKSKEEDFSNRKPES